MNKVINRTIGMIGKRRKLALPPIVETFGWKPGTKLDISITDDHAIILKLDCCTLCGANQASLVILTNGCICKDCIKKMAAEKISGTGPPE